VVSLSDVEQRRQAGSREDLVDHRTDVIEREPAAQGLRLLVQDDQVAQRALAVKNSTLPKSSRSRCRPGWLAGRRQRRAMACIFSASRALSIIFTRVV